MNKPTDIIRIFCSLAVICSALWTLPAFAQDEQKMIGMNEVLKTDFSKLDSLVLPPRDRLSTVLVPDRPENAINVDSIESCQKAGGKWDYVRDIAEEEFYRVGCMIHNKAEGLWTRTKDVFKLTAAQRKKNKRIADLYDLSSVTVAGYVWFVNGKREGWDILLDHDGGFVSEIAHYAQNVLDGTRMSWDSNGKLKGVYRFVQGDMEGLVEEYENGLPSQFGLASHNEPVGIWEIYNSGKLAQKVDFDRSVTFSELEPVIKTKSRNISLYKNFSKEMKLYWVEELDNQGHKYKSGFGVMGEGLFELIGDVQYYMATGEPWFVINLYRSKLDDKAIYELCRSENGDSFGGFNTNNNRMLRCKDSSGFIYKEIQYYANGQIHTITPYGDLDIINGNVTEYRQDGSVMSSYIMRNNFPAVAPVFLKEDGSRYTPESEINISLRNGVLRTFWENGNLRTETELANGMRNGIHRIYYENGSVHKEIPYVNNQKHGEMKSWFENGVISHTIEYSNGHQDGAQKYYYPTGDLASIQIYKNGNLTGTELEYYNGGALKSRIVHDETHTDQVQIESHNSGGAIVSSGPGVAEESGENASPTGIWNYYLPDGKIWYQLDLGNPPNEKIACEDAGGSFEINPAERSIGCSTYIPNRKVHQSPNTLRTGYWKWYSASGNVEKEGEFRLGQLDGTWSFYYPDGKIMLSGTYDNGVKMGKWVSYYDNGIPRFEGIYTDGIEDGEWKTFYQSNGKISSRGKFVNGQRVGEWNWFHENGKSKTKGSFENGLETGSWTDWYASGQKKGEGCFEDGKRTGAWNWWRENGELWRNAEFVDGNEVVKRTETPQ